jgi:hypothetical protein
MSRSDQGFVSLFTAIMISMLLLVITLSLVTLETLQLRKAEDSEQSLRAYYAAEAGVEDAVAKIRSGAITTGTPTSCATATIGPVSGGAMWTCQQVSFTGSPSGNLSGPPEEAAVTIVPGGSVSYNSVEIEWNEQAGPEPASYYNAWGAFCGGGGNCNFPSASGYVSGPPGPFAPPLELQIVKYPDGGFKASDVCTGGATGCPVTIQNGLFVPGARAGGSGVAPFGAFVGHGPWRANCAAAPRNNGYQASSAYNCVMVVQGLVSGNDYLFRLRSRYLATQYRMTFWTSANGGGTPVNVPSGMATIDVTARAGDAYRRVISQLPLGNSAANSLNYVIYSDGDVCKNFDVINNAAQPGCPY